MSAIWIDDEAALQEFLAPAAPHALLALDTEFMRTDTLRARLALVQVNRGDAIALLDAPRLGGHAALAARLADPQGLCVMHSASEDLEALACIAPRGPARLFDTQIAAALCGLGAGLSYRNLVAQLLDIEIAKDETRSDWLRRPLTQRQQDYAEQDVACLPRLHELLAARLAELDRGAWLAEDCQRLVDKVCLRTPDTQPQTAFPRAAEWPREAQARLRRALLWRECTARELDKPRPWLLDDAHALELAANPPRDAQDLFERCKGLRALRGPQRQQLFEILHAPLTAVDLDIAPIPPPLTHAQRREVAHLRDVVAEIAQKLNIPDSVLCPRRHLESLVVEHAWPAALAGWREALLRDALNAAAG